MYAHVNKWIKNNTTNNKKNKNVVIKTRWNTHNLSKDAWHTNKNREINTALCRDLLDITKEGIDQRIGQIWTNCFGHHIFLTAIKLNWSFNLFPDLSSCDRDCSNCLEEHLSRDESSSCRCCQPLSLWPQTSCVTCPRKWVAYSLAILTLLPASTFLSGSYCKLHSQLSLRQQTNSARSEKSKCLYGLTTPYGDRVK
jgi:hypothetical protein